MLETIKKLNFILSTSHKKKILFLLTLLIITVFFDMIGIGLLYPVIGLINGGTIDSFINVAAFTERGTILSTTEENYDKNFNVNVKAPLFMMQDVIKIMIRDKKKGTIAHILSMAAYSGMPFLTAYSASKAALAIMIKNVANSVSGHQIRVNGVNLGWTDTPAETTIQKKFHDADDEPSSTKICLGLNDKQLFRAIEYQRAICDAVSKRKLTARKLERALMANPARTILMENEETLPEPF